MADTDRMIGMADSIVRTKLVQHQIDHDHQRAEIENKALATGIVETTDHHLAHIHQRHDLIETTSAIDMIVQMSTA